MARTHPAVTAALATLFVLLVARQTATRADPPSPASDERPERSLPLSSLEKIAAALDSRTTVEFKGTPLSDVAALLARRHDINILLDRRALDDNAEVKTDQPVTCRVANVSLRSVLGLMLDPLYLNWTIQDEVLLITTREQAQSLLLTKVYKVGDLVTFRDEQGKPWADHDALIDTIEACIAPASWADVGGPGSISAMSLDGAEVLVVAQTWQIHDRIASLLGQLREVARRNPGDGKPPLRSRPKKSPPPTGGGMF